MVWVLQDKHYGLGNFVNLTPTISMMSGIIPVYFESDYVREVFMNWDKIKVLYKRPDTIPILSSSLICRSNEMPDYQFVYKRHFGKLDIPKTFVPKQKTAVFMNGCANKDKRKTKNPGSEIYNYIINQLRMRNYLCLFVGSAEDRTYSSFSLNCDEFILDNIKMATWLVQSADIVISNDTGLYHVAGAFQKKGFILWKDTLLPKNYSPNSNFFYSTNWEKDFNEWVLTNKL